MFIELLLLCFSIASILYLCVTKIYGYWRRKNVPGPVPTLFGGNIGGLFSGQKSLGDIFEEIYRKHRKYPFVGIYQIFTPAVFLIDLEVVKTVMIKDFTSFGENTIGFSNISSLLAKNPFVLKLQEWKPVRQQLTSVLSSSKLKSAVAVLNESGRKMVDYVKKEAALSKNVTTVEVKTLSTRYTAKNVASWGLGIEADTFKDGPSVFLELANELFQLTFFQNLSFFITMIFPLLGRILSTRIVSASVENRLVSIIRQSVQRRTESAADCNDYLGALISLKKSGDVTDSDLISHIGSLFIDGVETSAFMLHFVLYELAAHPEVQENLKKEIDEALKTNDSELISFETLQGMKYLDAVINEIFRLHPALTFLGKRTTKRYTLSGKTSDGEEIEVTLDADTPIIVPVSALHMDERYFPEPSIFNPQRFYGENKENIPKCSFMPFGEGPRTCVGKLFGTYQVKMGVIYLVKNFKIELGDGTTYPVVLDPTQFLSKPKKPIELRFETRT